MPTLAPKSGSSFVVKLIEVAAALVLLLLLLLLLGVWFAANADGWIGVRDIGLGLGLGLRLGLVLLPVLLVFAAIGVFALIAFEGGETDATDDETWLK